MRWKENLPKPLTPIFFWMPHQCEFCKDTVWLEEGFSRMVTLAVHELPNYCCKPCVVKKKLVGNWSATNYG